MSKKPFSAGIIIGMVTKEALASYPCSLKSVGADAFRFLAWPRDLLPES